MYSLWLIQNMYVRLQIEVHYDQDRFAIKSFWLEILVPLYMA